MRKTLLAGALISCCVTIALAFSPVQASISGKITPADAAEGVWAISTTDSVKGSITSGAFAIQVKPGIYKIIVDAKGPRKDVILENVEVKTQAVDVGEIVIQ